MGNLCHHIQAAHGKQAGRGPPRNISGNKEGKYSHLPGEGEWEMIVTVAMEHADKHTSTVHRYGGFITLLRFSMLSI